MGLFKKQSDPISERSRELKIKIAALESKIKKLNSEVHPGASGNPPEGSGSRGPADPLVFESVDQKPLKDRFEEPASPLHFNELGVRKFDPAALVARLTRHFRSPPTANPKLIRYLATGSVQGPRPLRYEKRVARNRSMALAAIFALAVLGIISYYLESHRH